MAPDDLKRRILDNHFVRDLLALWRIDEEAYTDLCGALRELAPVWRDVSAVDKELAAELYDISGITRNMADFFERRNLRKDADDVRSKWIELDALIQECHYGPPLKRAP